MQLQSYKMCLYYAFMSTALCSRSCVAMAVQPTTFREEYWRRHGWSDHIWYQWKHVQTKMKFYIFGVFSTCKFTSFGPSRKRNFAFLGLPEARIAQIQAWVTVQADLHTMSCNSTQYRRIQEFYDLRSYMLQKSFYSTTLLPTICCSDRVLSDPCTSDDKPSSPKDWSRKGSNHMSIAMNFFPSVAQSHVTCSDIAIALWIPAMGNCNDCVFRDKEIWYACMFFADIPTMSSLRTL